MVIEAIWDKIFENSMKTGSDISKKVGGLYVVHHNLPGKELEEHSHPEHILFIPLLGDLSVLHQGREIHCSPGRMLFLPPQSEHAFHSSKNQGERLIILIQKKALTRFPQAPSLHPAPQLLKELLFEILLSNEVATKLGIAKLFLKLLPSKLLETNLSQAEEGFSRAQDPRLKRAIELLRARLDESHSLVEVSKRAGLSERSLHRLSVKELGLAPKEVLQRLRVERALELLLRPNASVTSVSLDVGYQSLAQFIEVFRRHTGKLPSEFLHRS